MLEISTAVSHLTRSRTEAFPHIIQPWKAAMLDYSMCINTNLKIQTAVNYTGDLGVKCNLLLRKEIERAEVGIVNKIFLHQEGF